MKRIFLLALVLALLMLPMATASAAVKGSMFGGSTGADTAQDIEQDDNDGEDGFAPERILARVMEYLDSIDWDYDVDEDGDITFDMSIDSKLGSLSYRIVFFENGYTSYAYPNIYADTAAMNDIAEYLLRANYGLRNGNFELDVTDGEIRYKSYVDCSDALPGDEVVRRSVSIPASMFETYGDGLLQVAFGLMTPADAIDQAEN